MPLTPEERRTYEELKARQDAETHSIRRLIRYWVVAILTVVVLGSVVDLASNGEARTRYNKLDEDFLTGLAHVNPVYLANVYYHYVVESPDPDYNFLMNPFQQVMRMFWRAVLTGFIFTLWTVAKEGWPNAVLVGIAILLPFVPFFMVDDFFVPGGAIKKWLFFVAAVTVFSLDPLPLCVVYRPLLEGAFAVPGYLRIDSIYRRSLTQGYRASLLGESNQEAGERN